ncbi:MAG TPA: hypothetical protein VF266_03250 [Thermoanaerobaculia bacterium]
MRKVPIPGATGSIARAAPRLFLASSHAPDGFRGFVSGGTDVDRYFRAMPRAGKKMSAVVEPIDVAFYASLAERLTAAR